MNFPGWLAASAAALLAFQTVPAISGATSSLMGFMWIIDSPSHR